MGVNHRDFLLKIFAFGFVFFACNSLRAQFSRHNNKNAMTIQYDYNLQYNFLQMYTTVTTLRMTEGTYGFRHETVIQYLYYPTSAGL